MSVQIRPMQAEDIPAVAPLIDAYRRFYEQASDPALAERWLRQRFERDESRVFLAEQDQRIVGFAQLFPMLSTVRCARTWVLNDLYVAPAARGLGAGHALLDAVRDFARDDGVAYITLETMRSNQVAQNLYRKAGWTAEQTQWFSVDFDTTDTQEPSA